MDGIGSQGSDKHRDRNTTVDGDRVHEQQVHYKKVFVQRDYSEGMSVRFATKFPPELEGRIDRAAFENILGEINRIFAEAEDLSPRIFCESCFACLTAYTLYLCMDTHYEKCLKRVARYIEEQNKAQLAPQGVVMIDPAERGLRIIEIWVIS